MKVPKILNQGCEDCGFYHDCPMEYLCPAAEVIKFLQDEQEKGRAKILLREDLIKEPEEEE